MKLFIIILFSMHISFSSAKNRLATNIHPVLLPAKLCPAIRPPLNGFLELPCVEQYNSTCAVHCKKGFLLSGSNSVKCDLVGSKVGWINNNAKCNGEHIPLFSNE